MTELAKIPTWDLNDIYPGFDSERYCAAKQEVARLVEGLRTLLSEGAVAGESIIEALGADTPYSLGASHVASETPCRLVRQSSRYNQYA